MLAALPPVPAERLAAATPIAGRAPAPAPPSGHGFAELLQRGQASHGVLARPADGSASRSEPPPGNSADHEAEAETPADARPAVRPALTRAGAKPMLRMREKAAPATPATPLLARDVSSDTAGDGAGSLPSPADGVAGSAPTGAVPAASPYDGMAILPPPGQAATDVATPAPHDPAGVVSAGTATFVPAPMDPLRDAGAGAGAGAGNELPAEAGDNVASTEHALPAGLAQQPAVLAPEERRPASHEAPAVRDSVQPILIGAGGAVPRGFDPGTLAPISLPAPLHSPEFAQVLGAQVSVLARDGVQRAELHLNPAEMGPISVQIHLDGKDARVDFSAGTAATREVIERGLPELASALREQGLTLAGGGVFQQAPDPRDKPDGQPARPTSLWRGRITAEAAATPRAVSVPLPQGRLDLYA